jgi:hypothetical protein
VEESGWLLLVVPASMTAAAKATRAELIAKAVCRRNLERLVLPASQHSRTNSGQDTVSSSQVGAGTEEVDGVVGGVVEGVGQGGFAASTVGGKLGAGSCSARGGPAPAGADEESGVKWKGCGGEPSLGGSAGRGSLVRRRVALAPSESPGLSASTWDGGCSRATPISMARTRRRPPRVAAVRVGWAEGEVVVVSLSRCSELNAARGSGRVKVGSEDVV